MTDLTFAKLMEVRRMLFETVPAAPRFDTLLGSKKFAEMAAHQSIGAEIAAHKSVVGIRCYELAPDLVPRMPVMKISPDFKHVSPEFRAAWDAWALERFGTMECAYLIDAEVLRSLQRSITLSLDRSLAAAVMHGYSSAGDGPCPAP